MIIPTMGTTPTSTLGLGGTGVGVTSDILLFFRELRAFMEIPVIQDLIRQKANIPVSGNPVKQGEPELMKLTRHNVETGNTVTKKEVTMTPELYVMNQLSTPEGRKSLSDGLESVKLITGDITISKLQKALLEGDIKKK